MLWAIMRTVLGIYLLIGFLIYLTRAKAIEEDARDSAHKQNKRFGLIFAGKIAQSILLWPYVIATGRYKQ